MASFQDDRGTVGSLGTASPANITKKMSKNREKMVKKTGFAKAGRTMARGRKMK